MTHIWVNNLTIIGSDNGLWHGHRQAIIRTNDRLLSIGTLGTNINEILIEILAFSFQKIHLKMSSGKWWPFCPTLNVLTHSHRDLRGTSELTDPVLTYQPQGFVAFT